MIFQYRPDPRYFTLFILAFIFVPAFSSTIYYYVILPSWYQNPEQDFYSIKQVLVRHGELSTEDATTFSNDDISSNKSFVSEAVRLAQLELGIWTLVPKLILPLLVVLGIFTIFTLSFWVPGVTTHINRIEQGGHEKYLDNLPGKTLDFLSDYNRATISVGGFIIAILGGFLISSGLNNFYFFLGFETIILSLIASLLAYPSFISSVTQQNPIVIDKPKFIGYFKVSCFAGWFLVLGLILLGTSFS
jgi:hypothetical protein